MSKLLTEQELEDKLFNIAVVNVKDKETGDEMYALHPEDIISLIQSQKIAHGDMVINEDNWSNVNGTISAGGQTIKKETYINIRNQLRAEQRERNK